MDERCIWCDGHFTHSEDCQDFTAPSLLTVEQRVQLFAQIYAR